MHSYFQIYKICQFGTFDNFWVFFSCRIWFGLFTWNINFFHDDKLNPPFSETSEIRTNFFQWGATPADLSYLSWSSLTYMRQFIQGYFLGCSKHWIGDILSQGGSSKQWILDIISQAKFKVFALPNEFYFLGK